MRIISQDGKLDVPYEDAVIRILMNVIYILSKDLTEDRILATYSSIPKVERAMEMLHETYEEGEDRYFQFPKDGEIETTELRKEAD